MRVDIVENGLIVGVLSVPLLRRHVAEVVAQRDQHTVALVQGGFLPVLVKQQLRSETQLVIYKIGVHNWITSTYYVTLPGSNIALSYFLGRHPPGASDPAAWQTCKVELATDLSIATKKL